VVRNGPFWSMAPARRAEYNLTSCLSLLPIRTRLASSGEFKLGPDDEELRLAGNAPYETAAIPVRKCTS